MLASWLGHITYILIALSYIVRDILWLRIAAVVASATSVGYNYLAHAQPAWLVINWNLVFIAINVYRAGVLVRERRACTFTDIEAELHETIFRGLGDVEFMKLMRVAQWEAVEAGRALARQGEELDSLLLVYSGAVAVAVDGKFVATIRDGSFVGEMSFTTSGPASATVTASETVRIVRWPKALLRQLLERNPALAISIQAVLGVDMAKKLSGTRRRTRADVGADN